MGQLAENQNYELTPQIEWYRGSAIKRSIKKRKAFNINLINSVINGEWQNAKSISLKTGLYYFVVYKLLNTVTWQFYDIEVKEETWVDEKCRNRKRRLYRRKQKDMSLMDTMFGVKMPSFKEANVTKHYCMDD